MSGSCYCDDLCEGYGDCCDDYEAVCLDDGCEPSDGVVVGITWNGEAGREEIHTVDLSTLEHEFLAVIDDVQVTSGAFSDPFGRRVYLRARAPGSSQYELLGIDAISGETVSRVPLPQLELDPVTFEPIGGFAFGAGLHIMADETAVGVGWNGALQREEVHRVDLGTLDHDFVSMLPCVDITSGYWTDPFAGRVYVSGRKSDESVRRLVGIDAATGAVLSDPVQPELEFDPVTFEILGGFNFGAGFHVMQDGTTVGITWNGEAGREEIRTVDLSTLEHEFLAALDGIVTTSGAFADPFGGRVYLQARSEGEDFYRLHAIDATTGAVLSSPVMPELEFDPVTFEIVGGFNFGAGFHVMSGEVCD